MMRYLIDPMFEANEDFEDEETAYDRLMCDSYIQPKPGAKL